MIIDVGYAINDEVEYNHYTGVISEVNCSFCGGDGIIVGEDGTTWPCPKCNGTGVINVDNREKTEMVGTITDIRISWFRDDYNAEVSYLIGAEWVHSEDILGIHYEYEVPIEAGQTESDEYEDPSFDPEYIPTENPSSEM